MFENQQHLQKASNRKSSSPQIIIRWKFVQSSGIITRLKNSLTSSEIHGWLQNLQKMQDVVKNSQHILEILENIMHRLSKHTKSISDDWEICNWNKRTSTASYRNTPEYLNNQSYQLCSPKQWKTTKTLTMPKHLPICQSSLEKNVQVNSEESSKSVTCAKPINIVKTIWNSCEIVAQQYLW